MNSLLSFRFWFNLRPGPIGASMQSIFVYFLVALLILTLIFAFLKAKKKGFYNKVWRKLYSLTLYNLIIGILLLFFTYEMVPFLASRFWFLFWGLGIIVWLFFIIKDFVKIPELKENLAKEQEYKKYIP